MPAASIRSSIAWRMKVRSSLARVAVFLALATGIVLGGGPLSEVGAKVTSATIDAPAADPGAAPAQSSYDEAFADAVGPGLVAGSLAERQVAVLTVPGADEQVVTALSEEITAAGGTVSGRAELTARLLLFARSGDEVALSGLAVDKGWVVADTAPSSVQGGSLVTVSVTHVVDCAERRPSRSLGQRHPIGQGPHCSSRRRPCSPVRRPGGPQCSMTAPRSLSLRRAAAQRSERLASVTITGGGRPYGAILLQCSRSRSMSGMRRKASSRLTIRHLGRGHA